MKIRNENYPFYEHKDIHTLRELIYDKYLTMPNDIAFEYKENRELVKKTYKEFYEDALNLSNYFYDNYKGKNIGLMGENSYNWLVYFFAIILSGNVVSIIDKDSDEEKTKYLLKTSDTKIIYYSDSYVDFIDNIKVKSFKISDIDEYIKLGKKKVNKHVIDENETAAIFFTSGTTGPNKGVALSNRNMAFDIYAASSIFKPDGGVVSVLPFHHAFGLVTSVFKPFYYGVPIYLNTSLKMVLKDLQEFKPDTLFVVPLFVETFYKQIWKNARSTGKDKTLKKGIKISNGLLKIGIDVRKKMFKDVLNAFGGNVHYIICGGAYLDPKYVKWFRSIGIEILNGYGITECSPVVSVNRNHFYKDGSIGQKCRGLDVKIIDEEICVKGENVMLGYYKDKKATKEVIDDEGYFHTGDLGYIDNDGFIFVTGRKKNLIILSNGENISPEVIEASLLGDEAVCECVVYSKDNRIIACIYPNEEYLGDQEYFDNLIYKYNEDKPKNQQIALVELRSEEFEKNTNKKILRNKVTGE